MSEEEQEQGPDKPLSDVQRARHAAEGGRRGVHGKTARRLVHSYWDARAVLTVTTSHGNGCLFPSGVHSKKILWTALELEGRDASHSLDSDLAWEHVPSLLHEHAIAPPLVVKKSDGSVETTFQLEPLVEEVRGKDADDDVADRARRGKAKARTDGKLYKLNGKRPTLFAVPPTAPPEEITRGKLLLPVRMGDSRSSRNFPIVRRPGGAAWDVTQHGRVGVARLDVDLGSDCLLSHVSTQGRPPPTRVYPQVSRERRTLRSDLFGQRQSRMSALGRRAQRTVERWRREEEQADEAVGDFYWVEGRRWDLLKHGQYPGPFWDVLNLRGDEERCRRTGRPYLPSERWLQWVSKYELQYRVDGGRRWHSLGVMKGNADATSEVAHDMRGLRARYLRFIPLEVEGMGALRVGVYGHTAAAAAEGGCAGGEGGGEEKPDPISYTLRTCPEELNTRWTHCEKHTYRGGPRVRSWERMEVKRVARAWRRALRAEIRHDVYIRHVDVAAAEEGEEDEEDHAAEGEDDTDTSSSSTAKSAAVESAMVSGALERPTLSSWVEEQMLTRAMAARVAALETHDGMHHVGSESWAAGGWSEVQPEAWSEEAWSEAAWSEAAWSELSAEEQWLQVSAFG